MRGAEICEQSGQPGAVHADASFINALLGPSKLHWHDCNNLNSNMDAIIHQNEITSIGAAKQPKKPFVLLSSPLSYRSLFRKAKVTPLQEIQSCWGKEESLGFATNLAMEWLVVKLAGLSQIEHDNPVLSDQKAPIQASEDLNQQTLAGVSAHLEDYCIHSQDALTEARDSTIQDIRKQQGKGESSAPSSLISRRALHDTPFLTAMGWKPWCDQVLNEETVGCETACWTFLLRLRSNLHCNPPESDLLERQPA